MDPRLIREIGNHLKVLAAHLASKLDKNKMADIEKVVKFLQDMADQYNSWENPRKNTKPYALTLEIIEALHDDELPSIKNLCKSSQLNRDLVATLEKDINTVLHATNSNYPETFPSRETPITPQNSSRNSNLQPAESEEEKPTAGITHPTSPLPTEKDSSSLIIPVNQANSQPDSNLREFKEEKHTAGISNLPAESNAYNSIAFSIGGVIFLVAGGAVYLGVIAIDIGTFGVTALAALGISLLASGIYSMCKTHNDNNSAQKTATLTVP